MDGLGLYEDFPLFNGDLLEGFPLLATEEPVIELPEQDGLFTILKTSTIEAPTPVMELPKPTAKVVLGRPQQGSADLGLADLLASSPTHDLASHPLASAWMDTKVDILNLLTGDHGSASQSIISAAPAQATIMSRPVLLQLPMPSSPGFTGAAVVPSTSVPTTPEPALEDNSLQGSLDILQNLLSADVKMDTLNLGGASLLLHEQPQEDADVVYMPEQDLPFSYPSGSLEWEGEEFLMDFSATGLEDFISASLDASIEEGPILSPVTADDVESILSSSPPSPGNGLTSFIDTLSASPSQADSGYNSLNVSGTSVIADSDIISIVKYDPSIKFEAASPAPGPEHIAMEDVRSAPYTKGRAKRSRGDRKERKKEQNRSAALKYRQKKKDECGTVQEECDALESRNTDLRDKVESISREINYLKDLLAEVYKAKGVVPKKQIGRIIKKK